MAMIRHTREAMSRCVRLGLNAAKNKKKPAQKTLKQGVRIYKSRIRH